MNRITISDEMVERAASAYAAGQSINSRREFWKFILEAALGDLVERRKGERRAVCAEMARTEHQPKPLDANPDLVATGDLSTTLDEAVLRKRAGEAEERVKRRLEKAYNEGLFDGALHQRAQPSAGVPTGGGVRCRCHNARLANVTTVCTDARIVVSCADCGRRITAELPPAGSDPIGVAMTGANTGATQQDVNKTSSPEAPKAAVETCGGGVGPWRVDYERRKSGGTRTWDRMRGYLYWTYDSWLPDRRAIEPAASDNPASGLHEAPATTSVKSENTAEPEIHVSEGMMEAAYISRDAFTFSPMTNDILNDLRKGYTQIYRAMRLKEIEEKGA